MAQKIHIPTPKKRSKKNVIKTRKRSSKTPVPSENGANSGNHEPKITDRKSLELWLSDKPDEWKEDIAVRTALRVLPLVSRLAYPEVESQFKDGEQTMLTTFRSAFLSVHNEPLTSAPSKLHYNFSDISVKYIASIDQPAASAIESLISALGLDNSILERSLQAAEAAHLALSVNKKTSESPIWSSINADANWLIKRPDTPLMEQRLWLFPVNSNDPEGNNAPDHVLKPLYRMPEGFGSRKPFWKLWADWYLDVLNRDQTVPPSPLNTERASKVLSLPEEFWRGDLQKIAETILKIVNSITPDKPNESNQMRTNAQAHTDMPTIEDQLGRRPFARALVARMNDVWTKNEHAGGFAMHLHAPWGAGKSSVLLLMQEEMNRPAVGDPSWVCVDFNAWKHQRRKLPWWPMLEALKKGQLKTLRNKKTGNKRLAMEIRVKWILWKLASDGLPFLIAFIILALLFVTPFSNNGMMGNIPVLDILKTIGAAVTVFGGFLIAGRSLLFGSKSNAVFYFDLSKDPLKRISQLFTSLVSTTDRPICIFIDDLDRCAPDYVADLLEGIQTSFRHKNIFYVVAADRAWIRSSFEKRYQSFAQDVGNEGQPIGYLFLEKLFQLSSPLPGIGVDKREQFWKYLLDPGRKPEPHHNPEKPIPEISVQEIQENLIILKERDEVLTHEAAKQFDQEHASPAMTAAMIEYVNTSLKDEANRTHILYEFASLLPENPRIMKRVINAFAFRHAITLMEKTYIPLNKIARWTILEQQFPAVADVLAENPNCVDVIAKNVEPSQIKSIPDYLRPFNNLGTVRQILQSKLNGETDELNSALTPSDVALFTGVNREVSVSAT